MHGSGGIKPSAVGRFATSNEWLKLSLLAPRNEGVGTVWSRTGEPGCLTGAGIHGNEGCVASRVIGIDDRFYYRATSAPAHSDGQPGIEE